MDPLATGRPGSDSALPLLLEEPEDSYVVKNRAATLSCRAAHALQLHFNCNGESMPRGRHHSAHDFVDPMTGIRQLEVKLDISRNDVEEYFGLDGYGCECVAWSSFGQVKSRRAKVVVACKLSILFSSRFKDLCCFILSFFFGLGGLLIKETQFLAFIQCTQRQLTGRRRRKGEGEQTANANH